MFVDDPDDANGANYIEINDTIQECISEGVTLVPAVNTLKAMLHTYTSYASTINI
jgi:hypothetical protein